MRVRHARVRGVREVPGTKQALEGQVPLRLQNLLQLLATPTGRALDKPHGLPPETLPRASKSPRAASSLPALIIRLAVSQCDL